MSQDEDVRTLTGKEVCDMLGISRKRLNEWIEDGLPYIVMRSKRVKFLASTVRKFAIEQQQQAERK